MFGGPVKYLFYRILGIRREKDDAGFEKVVIDPKTNGTTGNGKVAVLLFRHYCILQ